MWKKVFKSLRKEETKTRSNDLITTNRFNEELPTFKYHESVKMTGILVEEDIVCECCQKGSHYKMDIVLYSEEEVEDLCPWCVADGSAAKKYNGTFIDLEGSDMIPSLEKRLELTRKNPGYPSWQENVWLAHCDDYCKYVDAVDYSVIEHLEVDLKEDFERLSKEFYYDTVEEFKEALKNNHSMQIYLFECLTCKKPRIHVDLD